MQSKGVEIKSIKEDIDTNTPEGKIKLSILLKLLAFERCNILENHKPKTKIPFIFVQVYERVLAKEITNREAFNILGLTKSTYYRMLKNYKL